MFTWICPQCGREVPPAYSECPTCAENRARGAAPVAPAPAPPQPQYAPPPQQPQYAPQQPQYAPPQQQYAPPPQPQYAPPPPPQPYAVQPAPPPVAPPPAAPPPPQPQFAAQAPQYTPPPPPPPQQPWQQAETQHSQPYYVVGEQPKKKVPAWLVMVGTAALLGLGLFGLYRYVDGGSKSEETAAAAKKAESATPPGTHPYAKFVEITGLRLSEEGKKVKVQYVVVNHSAAALAGMELKLTLTTVNAKPEDAPLAEFVSKVGDVDPFGSKDMAEQITTKLRAYELPDWQFLKATFEITAPQ
jgi:hypothetical protein